jgi:hypothetical protein
MTPQAREIIREVAARRGIDPELITRPGRAKKVFKARAEVAQRLHERGYSACRIGRLLHHDHTTILYYLGRGKFRKVLDLRQPWHKPRVRDLRPRWKKPHVETLRRLHPSKLYLIPYAGADMTEYEWRPRP